MELPTEKIKAVNSSPNRILIYSKPKQGKTSVLSQLENNLIIDTEDGSNYVDAMKVKLDISKPIHEQAEQLKDIFKSIYMKGYNSETKVYTPPYKYITIDTFSRLDEFSEIVGTLNYMDKAQGKKFNRDVQGNKLSPMAKDFETVHELGQGYGYKHSREVMLDWYNKICMLSPKTIFVCHVKDKLISTNLSDQVLTREISLTGKVKDIIASKVDTIGYGFREGNKFMISFSDGDGTRCSYLSGKTICLATSDDNGIVTTNWNEIFKD